MRSPISAILISTLCLYSTSFAATSTAIKASSYTATQATQKNITPSEELKRLKAGNNRFVNNKLMQRDLLKQAKITSLQGQFPATVILSCMDSRGSPELIFDQGLGDVFSVRVAGNVVDMDQIGGMEYATKVVGSKLIVVMGHTLCGAVEGACKNVQLGNLTALLNKIQPAVEKIKNASSKAINCSDHKTVNDIAKQNVLDMIQQVQDKSPIIQEQIKNNQVMIVGAMHDLSTGKIIFFDGQGKEI